MSEHDYRIAGAPRRNLATTQGEIREVWVFTAYCRRCRKEVSFEVKEGEEVQRYYGDYLGNTPTTPPARA